MSPSHSFVLQDWEKILRWKSKQGRHCHYVQGDDSSADKSHYRGRLRIRPSLFNEEKKTDRCGFYNASKTITIWSCFSTHPDNVQCYWTGEKEASSPGYNFTAATEETQSHGISENDDGVWHNHTQRSRKAGWYPNVKRLQWTSARSILKMHKRCMFCWTAWTIVLLRCFKHS